MSEIIQELLDREIGVIEDNLERARLVQKRNGNYKSGNGETIKSIIAGYEKRLAEVKEIKRAETKKGRCG